MLRVVCRMNCDSALMNPASYCTKSPRWEVETWEIVPFMLLVSTVSNVQTPFVQLEALINRMKDDKSMIT